MSIMRAIMGCILFLLIPTSLHGDQMSAIEKEKSKNILVGIIAKIKATSDSAKYFRSLDVGKINVEYETKNNGWRWIWRCQNGVNYIANPDKGGSAVTIPVIESDNGILLVIFIAYDHGGDLIGRDKTYIISENPSLSIGYELITKSPDSVLKKIVDEAIRSSVPVLKVQ